MKTTTFTELRRHAKKYFDAVEQGETVRIKRHGRIIAKIVPADDSTKPSWQKPALRLVVPGVRLSRMILTERNDTNR